MARKRKSQVKRASTTRRASFTRKKAKSRSSSKGSSMNKVLMQVGTSAVYGGGREYVNVKMRELATKLGFNLANVSDEVLMTGATYLLSQPKIPLVGLKVPSMVRSVASQGLSIEGANIGRQIASKYLNKATATATASTGLKVIG